MENKILFGFLMSVMVLAGIGWLSYRTNLNLVSQEDLVSHTYQVIATLESGRAILTDAETSQRGYLLTGDDRFLTDCTNAQAKVQGWFNSLQSLVSDNREQMQRLNKLEPMVQRRLMLLNDRIRLLQEQGMQAAINGVKSREGSDLMSQIQTEISHMISIESDLVLKRQNEARHRALVSEYFIIGGSLLACVVGLLAIIWIHRDLKLRGQIHEQLQENRAFIQGILNHLPAMVSVKDLQGRYLFVNKKFTELANQTTESIVGKTPYDVLPKDIAQRVVGQHQEILISESPIQLEETVNYPDGFHTHLAIKFPMRDARGKIFATASVSSDITERKRAQEELDRFFSLSLDFLCIASADGYFKRVSPAVTDILGWSVEEFLSRPFVEFVHPEDRAATLEEVDKQVNKGERVLRFENRYQHKDSSWRVLSWRSTPQPGGLMYATARDVTDRKKFEDELRRQKVELETTNKELEAFSYSVSHDLRAPLRHIDGFVDLLRKQSAEKMDERGRRYLDIIANSAKRMGVLIDDLLIFSRMSRSDLRHSKVASESLVHEVKDSLQSEIAGRQVVWKMDSLPQVEADAAMLRQVWANLIGNAVKYSRTRNPAQIEIGCKDSDEDEWVFYVRDNGVGFDMQYVDKLFGVFQRLHRSDEFEGTGIGLANVRRIISRHGGRTWAEAEIDNGATFYFSLPKNVNSKKS